MRLFVLTSFLALCFPAALAQQAAQSGLPAAVAAGAPDDDRFGRFVAAYQRSGGALVERLHDADVAPRVPAALADRAGKLAAECAKIVKAQAQVPDQRIAAALQETLAVAAAIAAWQGETGESLAAPRLAGVPADRVPLATDTGVAWDMINHRGQMRWDCRALPSGKFVMNSLCANAVKHDLHWPGTAPPSGWDGIVHED